MPSYKIFLTKSSEVARRIQASFSGDFATEDITRTSQGKVNEDSELIPAIYHNKGFFYCTVELAPFGENDTPTYELTIC